MVYLLTYLLTAKWSCAVSAVWTHPSAVVTQFTISCAAELLRLMTSDDIMTSLLKKLSTSIKIHVVKPLWSQVCLVSKLSTESVGSRRELVVNCVHTADAHATQLGSCVASASAVCVLGTMAVFCLPCYLQLFMSTVWSLSSDSPVMAYRPIWIPCLSGVCLMPTLKHCCLYHVMVCTGLWIGLYAVWVGLKNPPLRFTGIFPKRLGIFRPNFTHLLHVPIYARMHICIQLPLDTKLCHIKCYHLACFSIDGGQFLSI